MGLVLHRSNARSNQQAPTASQPALKLLELRYLIFDSILRPPKAFSAYIPSSSTIMVKFAVSDIPDLKEKVILVTGGISDL